MPSTLAETASYTTISLSPSPSSGSYIFKFPQGSCGNPSADPDTAFPIFIDDKSVDEVRNQYCKDAYPISKHEKTGKPSVQVASFTDRNKAEAFAQKVGGEVGKPHQLEQNANP